MNKIIFILIGLCLNTIVCAESGQAYLEKFMKFTQWSQNFPAASDPDFLAFIDGTTPLSQKLRERWLYQLAREQNWAMYSKHYQPSTDINLQCYEQKAQYQLGQHQEAIQGAQKLWLSGSSQPQACNDLFSMLLKSHEIDEKLITQRIILALDQRNLSLAIYLLKQYNPPQLQEISILTSINQSPSRILQLSPSFLHSEFYLFGLKRMVSINIDKAIQYWQLPKTKQMLNHAQQQAFLAQLALYKAMRNQADAPEWFAKVEPAFYNDALLDWQILYALKYRQWRQVEHLINNSKNRETPCWQYWLARALEAQGQTDKAKEIYQNIAKTRNYYGFLASIRLKKNFSFEEEHAVNNYHTLSPYQPFTEQIKALYHSKQTLQASRLLNDFVSELPKEDKSALINWIANDLQWHGKSVYLSNNEELGNQLSLRFPLAHQQSISTSAKQFQIPQELIYAIIRQESGFRDDATSTAGARGLMQLMPATAKVVSKSERISYTDNQQLFAPQKNISLGAAYLKELSKRFDQHPILMVAAYNAGPKQVRYWLKNHPPQDIDIWIETLPWFETRNYIKNVIAFYAVYQHRLQKRADLSSFMKGFAVGQRS